MRVGRTSKLVQQHGDTVAAGARSRVRISDVAEALGITKSTVSRALNGYPDIAETTRRRVQRTAEAMGYRPLAQAQAIRTGRSRALGLVLQTDMPGAQRAFLSDFLAGVTQAASAANWTLTVATSTGADMIPTLDRLTDERKADGFILPRTYTKDRRMRFLRSKGVPFVLFGRVPDSDGCAWFDILGENAMSDAVSRLAGHGHRRIAFVGGGAEYSFAGLREDGFRHGMAAENLPMDNELVNLTAMTREAGAIAVRKLLMLDQPPTAIIFAIDAAALGAYDAARDFGLEIGKDLSIISYDGIPEGDWAQPNLTTYNADSRRSGERLAALLIRRIRGVAPEELRETVNATLKVGGSDGPPRLSSFEIARRVATMGANNSQKPLGGGPT